MNVKKATCIVAIVGCALWAAQLHSQDGGAKKKPAAQQGEAGDAAGLDQEAMMKKWMEVATPGAPHKALAPLVGSWNTKSRFWMEGPDGPVTESDGTAEFHWILGDRFLQQDAQGTVLGMPFTGMGITGYDNFKKKYVTSWIDSAGTGLFTSEGFADKEGKAFTFYGKMDDFMTGEHDKPVKYVQRILGPDKHVFSMYDLAVSEEKPVGEIHYTRKD